MSQGKIAGAKPAAQVARLALAALQYGSTRNSMRAASDHRAAAEEMTEMFRQAQMQRTEQAIRNLQYTRPHIVIPAPVPGLQRWDGNDVMLGMDGGMVRLASAGFGRDLAEDFQKEALSLQPLVGAAKGAFGALAGAGAKAGRGLMGGAKGMLAGGLPGAAQGMAGAIRAPAAPMTMGQAAGKIRDWATALPGKAEKAWQQSGINTLQGAKRTAIGLGMGAGALYLGTKALRGASNLMSQEAHPARYGTQQFGGSRIAYGVNEYGQPDTRAPVM